MWLYATIIGLAFAMNDTYPRKSKENGSVIETMTSQRSPKGKISIVQLKLSHATQTFSGTCFFETIVGFLDFLIGKML